jgi:hypothetical protein
MVSAQRLFALHEHSERTGMPVAEVLGAVEAKRARPCSCFQCRQSDKA